ncbi:hypothetical protein SEA_GOBY_44 [Streptomyces phage Goby]|uniref:Uncharacterized protein n=1 Tax=Streptomyces phage Goby TaxID=2182319 RepID=A0A2U8UTV1_9CAUD|nr:hypothetical protein KGH00_gp44 [Streptomyces phage Goby]ATE85149.1 hypothetical protein SEA_DATTRAN_46 [Streptomyces phage Dattran]AWN07562.1 hypothetical protein SEA_GOBY_44 [Streptomyces phage Goby]AWN07638.1 hypothetical protein SEA_TOMA_44 [Streptomyces phage Toma]
MKIIEITNAYESAEEARADWSLIEDPDVARAAGLAARSFSNDYTGVVEYDDMQQELLVLFATTESARVRLLLAEADNPVGMLKTHGYRVLRSKFKATATNLRRHTSFEGEQEKFNPEVS